MYHCRFSWYYPLSIANLNHLIISVILTSSNHLMPYFSTIWVNITSMAVCKYDVACLLSVFLVFTSKCLPLSNFPEWWTLRSYNPDTVVGWSYLPFHASFLRSLDIFLYYLCRIFIGRLWTWTYLSHFRSQYPFVG